MIPIDPSSDIVVEKYSAPLKNSSSLPKLITVIESPNNSTSMGVQKITPQIVQIKRKKFKIKLPSKHPQSKQTSKKTLTSFKNPQFTSKETLNRSYDITRDKINFEEKKNFNVKNPPDSLTPEISNRENPEENESEKMLNPRFYHFAKYSNLKTNSKDFTTESGVEDEEISEASMDSDKNIVKRNSQSVEFLNNREKRIELETEEVETIKIPIKIIEPLPVKLNKKRRRGILRKKRFEKNLTMFNHAWNKLELKDAVYLKMLDFKPGRTRHKLRFGRKIKKNAKRITDAQMNKIKDLEIKRRKKKKSLSPQKRKQRPPFITNFAKNSWYSPNLPNEIYKSLVEIDNNKLKKSIKRQNIGQISSFMHRSLRFGEHFNRRKFHKSVPGRPVFLVRKSNWKRSRNVEKRKRKKIFSSTFSRKIPVVKKPDMRSKSAYSGRRASKDERRLQRVRIKVKLNFSNFFFNSNFLESKNCP